MNTTKTLVISIFIIINAIIICGCKSRPSACACEERYKKYQEDSIRVEENNRNKVESDHVGISAAVEGEMKECRELYDNIDVAHEECQKSKR